MVKINLEKLAETAPELSVMKVLADAYGGSASAYEKTLSVTLKLLPGNLKALNNLLETGSSDYSVKIHGLKGALRTIGAFQLGLKAEELEKLSKSGAEDGLTELHSEFMREAEGLLEKLSLAAYEEKSETTLTYEQTRKRLLEIIPLMSEFISDYDCGGALKLIYPLKSASTGAEADELITLITDALERFDPLKAEEHLESLLTVISV